MDKTKALKDKLEGYHVKGAFAVKDVDTQTRRVRVMLSHFDNVDSDNDVIRKGAFSKSIVERGPEADSNRKIAFLRYHDWEHQIGKFIHLEETHEGLIATAEMGTSPLGEAALLDYQEEVIREHSIGFNYISDKMDLVEHGDSFFWDIKEVQLWEGSAVTFGSNSLTPTLDVSKGNQLEVVEKINAKMNTIQKALRDGKGPDERFYNLEMALKVCQAQYNSLLTKQPTVEVTVKEEPKETKQDQRSFYLGLLNK